MKNNAHILEKQAIDAALNSLWEEAVRLNLEILEIEPSALDAKLRLGKAYIQLEEFNKAKKIYKEVLEIDPVNQTAQRNLKLASEKKSEKNPASITVNTGSLIKEPGTTQDVELEICAKRVMAYDFTPGEEFELKVEKSAANFYREEIMIATLADDLLQKLQSAKSKGATLTAHFTSGEGKNIQVLLRSSIPVFKSERQDVRPYIKKGSIDEPELEIPEVEE